jgi:hypothetical protein
VWYKERLGRYSKNFDVLGFGYGLGAVGEVALKHEEA